MIKNNPVSGSVLSLNGHAPVSEETLRSAFNGMYVLQLLQKNNLSSENSMPNISKRTVFIATSVLTMLGFCCYAYNNRSPADLLDSNDDLDAFTKQFSESSVPKKPDAESSSFSKNIGLTDEEMESFEFRRLDICTHTVSVPIPIPPGYIDKSTGRPVTLEARIEVKATTVGKGDDSLEGGAYRKIQLIVIKAVRDMLREV